MKYSLLIKLIIALSFSFNLLAANINTLKDELNQKSFKVTKLAATINSIDKSIGQNNRKYLDKRDQLNQIDLELVKFKQELSASADDVAKDYELVNKIFRQYLLDRMDHGDDNKILKDKIYIQTLSLQLEELNHAQLESKKMLDQVNKLSNDLSIIKQEEQAIYDLIVELETDKKNKSQDYLNQLESKNSIREKLEKALAKKRVSKYKKSNFSKKKTYSISKFKNKNLRLPIDGFNSFKGGKKGVTFTFDKVSPVLASSSGHVAYSGELASYGRIIMIDHGNDIRSLVLGDIKINVKKGDFVNKGQVLAYTVSEPGLTKNLYYELRKKNIAQNTLQILKDNKVL